MSYDLELFHLREGETAADAFARIVKTRSGDDPDPGPVMPEIRTMMQSLAAALQQKMPSLVHSELDYARIAGLRQTGEVEAPRRWRHIELNEDAFGLQIVLHGETASVTLPYWHERPKAEAAFRAVRDCLAILRDRADYCTYDPQLDRALDLGSVSDFDAVLDCYLSTRRAVQHAINANAKPKPWWRFW